LFHPAAQPQRKKAAVKAAAFPTTKINPNPQSQFQPPKNDRQQTTFTTQSTTTSPQKHHAQPTTSPKNPCKNTNPTTTIFSAKLN
jgi:hypothetical protein